MLEPDQQVPSQDSTRAAIDLLELVSAAIADPCIVAKLESENQHLRSELEQWKAEANRLAQVLDLLKSQQQTPRENVDPNQIQLAFEKLAPDLLKHLPARADAQGSDSSQPPAKERKQTGHGRGVLPENLPVDTIVIMPQNLPEGAQLIGEDVSYKLSFRRASFRRLKVVRPRYAVPTESVGQCEGDQVRYFEGSSFSALGTAIGIPGRATSDLGLPVQPAPSQDSSTAPLVAEQVVPKPSGDTTIIQSNAPADIIPRGLPTNELLASILTGKFADKQPFNRQEEIFSRIGMNVSRTVMCQWNEAVSEKLRPVVAEMERDARENADVIHTDATGILVQQKQRCKKGSFWVYVSDNGHVIFRYSSDSSADEPKKFFAGYRGIIVADATATLDAIVASDDGPSDRAGCHSHARRYFYKALDTERDLALIGIGLSNKLFELERAWTKLPPAERLTLRQKHSAPVFQALLTWAKQELTTAEAGSRLYKALFYFTNNEKELGCFLRDGKVALTNNVSERQLRSLVIGRANWLFIGGDHTGPWTASATTLIGSCAMHGLDPESYLRDLLRVLPNWPKNRLLELCPREWPSTKMRLNAFELALPLGPLTVPAIGG